MAENAPDLTKAPPLGSKRDAIHVAIIPLVAPRVMRPGEHLANGIVNPFLKEPVQPGEAFWLFLYPGTVTGIRHVWSHPAFAEEK